MQLNTDIMACGALVSKLIEACGVFEHRARRLFNEKGISDVVPDAWYPLSTVLEVVLELKKTVGTDIICEMGKQVAINMKRLDDVHTLAEVLRNMDEICYLSAQNGVRGFYETIEQKDRQFLIRCTNPFPLNFNLGILRGLARKYAILARIEQVPSEVSGGEFLVKW